MDVGTPSGFYVEEPSGRIHHRAEPLILVLALLVVPAIVLEETSSDALQAAASEGVGPRERLPDRAVRGHSTRQRSTCLAEDEASDERPCGASVLRLGYLLDVITVLRLRGNKDFLYRSEHELTSDRWHSRGRFTPFSSHALDRLRRRCVPHGFEPTSLRFVVLPEHGMCLHVNGARGIEDIHSEGAVQAIEELAKEGIHIAIGPSRNEPRSPPIHRVQRRSRRYRAR